MEDNGGGMSEEELIKVKEAFIRPSLRGLDWVCSVLKCVLQPTVGV